jgi:hypothetical protein
MLAQGEGYFSDTYLFFLGVQGGVTSRFNIGGGISILPLESFTDNIVFITPKIGLVTSPTFNLAVGGLVGYAGGLVESGANANFGILYAVGTSGPPSGSISYGAGMAYGDGRLADRPVLMLGGERRLSRRISFVTENYLIADRGNNSLISYGLRFFGEKLSTDLAFWNLPGDHMVFPGIPYVAFSMKF